MSPDLERDVAVQREVTRIALAGVDGFALAGSGAIREHGMIDRPTEDVDLFTTSQDVTEFSAAVDQVSEQLRAGGFTVDQTRRAAQFARLHVVTGDGRQVDVDLGVDWRQDDPVQLEVGPVLSLADAVGNKVSALYSRGEPRDYLDVDAIRRSGRFSDEQLVAAAAERDAGFEVGMFADQLTAVSRIRLRDVRAYGVTADQLEDIKTRSVQWSDTLRHQPDEHNEAGAGSGSGLSGEELRQLIQLRQAKLPDAGYEATKGVARPAPDQSDVRSRHTLRGPDRGIEL